MDGCHRLKGIHNVFWLANPDNLCFALAEDDLHGDQWKDGQIRFYKHGNQPRGCDPDDEASNDQEGYGWCCQEDDGDEESDGHQDYYQRKVTDVEYGHGFVVNYVFGRLCWEEVFWSYGWCADSCLAWSACGVALRCVIANGTW